jgi:general secretion pathway protein C
VSFSVSNLQDLVKRHFWVVAVLTIATCAFFAGRTVAHIVEGKLLTDPAKAAKIDPITPVKAGGTASTGKNKSGQALVERNIFCSDCAPPVVAADPGVTPDPEGGVPLTGLPLQLISTFIAEDYRMATILNVETQAQGGYLLLIRDGKPVGDKIPGAGEIVAIGYKYVDFRNESASQRLERVSLVDTRPPVVAEAPVNTAPTPTEGGPPKDEMSAALDAGIRKIDENTYEVDRSLIDKLLQNPLAASKGARVTPSIKNGKPNGIKLYAIRPSSVYSKLGLSNGDTIHSINGNELDSMEKGLEVYQKVKDASSLQVSVTRRGKPLTLNYSIK